MEKQALKPLYLVTTFFHPLISNDIINNVQYQVTKHFVLVIQWACCDVNKPSTNSDVKFTAVEINKAKEQKF